MEEERESMLSFGIQIYGGGGGGEKNFIYRFGVDLTLEKEEGFQFQTSQGMNGKTAVSDGEKT